MGWLYLETLWVADQARGRGTGSALLRQGEARAIDMGAHSVFLDTFQWQAEPFYARHGYEVFGRLEHFPVGSARTFMRKTLDASRALAQDGEGVA